MGGFLASGNVTLLAAVEDDQVETVLGVIRKTCRTRTRFINPLPAGAEPAHLALGCADLPAGSADRRRYRVLLARSNVLHDWAGTSLRPAPSRRPRPSPTEEQMPWIWC